MSGPVQALHLSSIRTFLGWCARRDLISHDPGADLEMPRIAVRLPPRVLSAGQAELVLRQPDLRGPRGLRDRAILEVLYSTAIRRLELIHLGLGDIDPARRTCFIREGKGRRDRVIPIGTRALAWVHRYMMDERCEVAGAGDTLFLTAKGKPFAPSRVSELVRRYFILAGLGPIGACHVFRHTAATLMLDGGADIRHIQALLGHTDIRTTARYTQVSIAALQGVHERTHPGERAWRESTGGGS
jgi:integrase/recombinase XerD